MSYQGKKDCESKLQFETLENKRLLTILWENEFGTGVNDPNFDNHYGANEVYARALVNRAIDDWERVINNFNYAVDHDTNPNNNLNDTFTLSIFANPIAGRGSSFNFQASPVDGKPIAATINLDDNGGGAGWFFDQSPLDDIEFTSMADAFHASFIDATVAGQTNLHDFYRTITHEIGHSLGITVGFSRFNNLVSAITSPPTPGLRTFSGPGGTTATLTSASQGTHLYPGSPSDPAGFLSHPHQLMNPGSTVPSGSDPSETTRQFITDLTVEMLEEAYGYTVTLPSTLDSAHVMLDDLTGTLLVQGSVRDNDTGAGVADVITIERVTDVHGDDIRVTVAPAGGGTFTERVPYDQVTEILVNGNDPVFSSDTLIVNPNVAQPVTEVAYVVSTNQDILEDSDSAGGSGITNGIVDINTNIPGSQTPLRAAILEANALPGNRPIYVGRGIYDLTLDGSGGDAEGDFDIYNSSDMTIIGAGAGVTVINSSAVNDRSFDVSGTLDLSQVTLTGGNTSGPTNGTGGAIWARTGSSLTVSKSAIVDNTTTGVGGAIRNQGTTLITNSVIVDNTGGSSTGGIYDDTPTNTTTLGGTIVARNKVGMTEINFNSIPSSTYVSNGNNIFSSVPTNLESILNISADGNPNDDDRIEALDYIVTSISDVSNPVDNNYALTLREALASVSFADGDPSETVAVPGWTFVVDHFIPLSFNTRLLGVDSSLTEVISNDPTDVVFAILGDFDRNGIIGNDDLTLLLDDWGGTTGSLMHEEEWERYFLTGDYNNTTIGNDRLTELLNGWGFGGSTSNEGIFDITWQAPA